MESTDSKIITSVKKRGRGTVFFARVDEAREEIRQGKGIQMLPNESLDDFLKRVA